MQGPERPSRPRQGFRSGAARRASSPIARIARLGCIGWILIGALLPAAAASALEAAGVVFEDLDADGARDPGEPGLPGVRVSDGRRIVATDAEGRYRLDLDGDAVVFVIKPSGFATPVDARMLPRFYHVHQPGGSPPGLRYPGVEPSGPLPASIDFPLLRTREPERFEAILFADTQPQTAAEVDAIRDDVVAELIGTDARFGMTMGDILFDDLSLFPRYLSVVARIGIPWYNVPGNHELNLLAADDAHSLETFKRWFGPPYYAFDVGRVHFVVLDNIFYAGNGQADPADYRGDGGYEARIDETQLAWLERDLEDVPEDRLVFLAMHAPLLSNVGKPGNAGTNTANRAELLRLLEGRENLYAVAGHTHTTEHHYLGEAEGFPGPGELHHHVLATVSGSWWSGPIDERGIAVTPQRDGTPNGYHVLEIDGVDLAVRYKAAGRPAGEQMRVLFDVAHHHHRSEATRDFRPGELLDGRLSVDEVPAARVLVNLYDGGPRSRVAFSVDDGAPVEMERREMVDPWVAELFQRHADTVKPWVKPLRSTHVFVADLPDELAPGTYTLSVHAVDEFGRAHHAHRVVEVEGSSATPAGALRYPAPGPERDGDDGRGRRR